MMILVRTLVGRKQQAEGSIEDSFKFPIRSRSDFEDLEEALLSRDKRQILVSEQSIVSSERAVLALITFGILSLHVETGRFSNKKIGRYEMLYMSP
jgi:hypothetical protein